MSARTMDNKKMIAKEHREASGGDRNILPFDSCSEYRAVDICQYSLTFTHKSLTLGVDFKE